MSLKWLIKSFIYPTGIGYDDESKGSTNRKPRQYEEYYSEYYKNSYDRQDYFYDYSSDEGEISEKLETPPKIQLSILTVFTVGWIILFTQMLLGQTDPPNIPYIQQFFDGKIIDVGRSLIENPSMGNVLARWVVIY